MPRASNDSLSTGSKGREAGAASGALRRTSRPPSDASISAVIERAREMGLMASGTKQVGARLPTKLLEQARRRTGITSTSDLLSFALANVAVEDNFANAFIAARGKLDPSLDIGF